MPVDPERSSRDSDRLERLWAGDFGDAYSERNAAAGEGRDAFWAMLLATYPIQRVLEVGCNAGANLRWLASLVPSGDLYGVDVNLGALAEARKRVPDINALVAPARELPFRDAWFDLAFTTGVLIHQPDSTLPQVMSELVRVSRRYVLCAEYFAPEAIDVPYHGQPGSLFKRDYGGLYGELFPALQLVDQGTLSRDAGWDDVTWWLFEKPQSPRRDSPTGD